MKRHIIIGLIAALMTGTVVLVAAAAEGDNRAPFWPRLKPGTPPLFTESYSDVPWHQKLGTYAGNQIDQALVLPYEVLGTDSQKLCKDLGYSQEQCMIEIGVSNIIGYFRTDTPYDPTDDKIGNAKYCQDPKLPCIEVKLEWSLWRSQPTGEQLPARPIDLKQQTFGFERPEVQNYPSGVVITDGSAYAPQMPWYMSHYCDSKFGKLVDAQDPVCYADYLSPMNSGFNYSNGASGGWPNQGAFSVYPFAQPPPENQVSNHCKPGLKTCTVALAAFELTPVQTDMAKLQYRPYNENLIRWFNRALAQFPDDVTEAERLRHFAWITKAVSWEDFVYPQALFNPFQGTFPNTPKPDPGPNCDVTFDGTVVLLPPPPEPGKCPNTGNQFAQRFLYPRQCTLNDLAGAAGADLAMVERLRQCSLNFELHPNGFKAQWPDNGGDFDAAAMGGNQYGRTSFLFGGVRGMQLPVSFFKDTKSDSGLSIYEQVYNASIFSMYLPVANVADFKNGMDGRNYTDTQFYHTLLMSNHNESDPPAFADGIRGKVLWHNEYRMEGMYSQKSRDIFRARMFAAAFDPAPEKAKAPFHNNTCDGCHVRNGSGIPINTELKLDKALQGFMTDRKYNFDDTGKERERDYTFTGTIRPMKLVFFDLRRDAKSLDASRYSEPLSLPPAVAARSAGKVRGDDTYYHNKIMNYYGDSFHVTTPGYNYAWSYVAIPKESDRLVVKDPRKNSQLPEPYQPLQIKLDTFQTSSSCVPDNDIVLPAPTTRPWPSNCDEINGAAITVAIAGHEVGFMHLNGKRLGNLSAMEAIPNQAIIGFRDSQRAPLGDKIAGEIIWQAGSRDGIDGKVQKCEDGKPKDLTQCFIGRFGWIGDRVSLEDQVANAAFVEMNMLTSAGYKKLYPNDDAKFPIRYAYPNCGPANKTCGNSKGNADLTERDVERMADYARWLGNPTRSEFQVALPEVIAGEKLFRSANCDTCHVIRKIEIDPDDTMLTVVFRDRLKTRVKAATADGPKAAPFLSYIGTDLLMHDMGYLSQVADSSKPIRDSDGVVLQLYENYVQKIRTPALKGLGLNRFVTDSYKNTKSYDPDPSKFKLDAACDFLLHDGRACDAIEAAFLHDGPAIKKLGVITKLNAMDENQIKYLRAFLYSL